MKKTPPVPPVRGVLEVDWPFFGEICRALALKVARAYQPEIELGIARAGVIPGVVIASILDVEFASMAVTRHSAGDEPMLEVIFAGDKCSACKMCVAACPAKAMEVRFDRSLIE